jgi:hypothetical protein
LPTTQQRPLEAANLALRPSPFPSSDACQAVTGHPWYSLGSSEPTSSKAVHDELEVIKKCKIFAIDRTSKSSRVAPFQLRLPQLKSSPSSSCLTIFLHHVVASASNVLPAGIGRGVAYSADRCRKTTRCECPIDLHYPRTSHCHPRRLGEHRRPELQLGGGRKPRRGCRLPFHGQPGLFLHMDPRLSPHLYDAHR